MQQTECAHAPEVLIFRHARWMLMVPPMAERDADQGRSCGPILRDQFVTNLVA